MAELPGVAREALDVDVVIVGAGPAGLAAAYELSRLIKAHNETAEKKLEGISIAVLEKGKEVGSHGISGAVMDPRGISELMPDWLQRGCPVESPVTDDGFWLIDTVEHPINKERSGPRRRAIAAAVPRLVERCRELAPDRGVIVCHGLVYQLAAPALRQASVRLLHDEPLPFPLGNWRARFVSGMRKALADGTA